MLTRVSAVAPIALLFLLFWGGAVMADSQDKADAAHTFTSRHGRIVRAAPLPAPERRPAAAPGSTRHGELDESDQMGWGKPGKGERAGSRIKPRCRYGEVMSDEDIAACKKPL